MKSNVSSLIVAFTLLAACKPAQQANTDAAAQANALQQSKDGVPYRVFKYDPKDLTALEIEWAYKSADGKIAVLFKTEYSATQVIPLWVRSGTFWGTQENLYQQRVLGTSTSGSSSDFSFHARHAAGLPKTIDSETNWDGNASGLTINAKGKHPMMLKAMTGAEKAALLTRVKQGNTKLNSIKLGRQPAYLFQIKKTGGMIFLDEPTMAFDYEFTAFVGTKGNMTQAAVSNVKRYADGGTTFMEIAGLGDLTTPAVATGKAPTLLRPTHETVELVRLRGNLIDQAVALGVPANRFTIHEQVTPYGDLR